MGNPTPCQVGRAHWFNFPAHRDRSRTRRIAMKFPETIKLLQFRAAYNLPVHAGVESGIFAHHGLGVEAAYTPGSVFLSEALRAGRCDIGHTGADDVIADVENTEGSDLFIFMGLHPGLFSLVGAPDCPSRQFTARQIHWRRCQNQRPGLSAGKIAPGPRLCERRL